MRDQCKWRSCGFRRLLLPRFSQLHSVLLLGLIDIGMSAWPSTVNSSLGLVLALLVVLMRSYYVESPATTTAEAEEWVVPVDWEDERKKRE